MQGNTQDKSATRTELLQSIFGQTHISGVNSQLPHHESLNQGYEIYTGLDYSIKTTVTTNTISARNA
jgi:hypothetical protein